MHATDPASVYLQVLARCRSATLADVADVMYARRAMVRLMAMRRTLFVVAVEDVPLVHHAASLDVAATMRRRLLSQLATIPTDPPLPGDLDAWLREVEAGVERAITARGTATGAQLAKDEPRLATAFLPVSDKAYDVRRAITSQVLTLVACEGRLVRSAPRGSWLSRQHTWEPAASWWPDGLPPVADARPALAQAYLRRFGPATAADVQWWTGWNGRTTAAALAALDVVDVGCGLVLSDDADPQAPPPPSAALLPALDATAMGWQDRSWFLPADRTPLFDRNGNIGPTVWWDGEVVGGWAVRPDGTLVHRLLVDRGREAADAVEAAVAALQPRLAGAAVVPSFPTPLEKALRLGA